MYTDLRNVLDIKNIPKATIDPNAACFFDCGAWHGFALPEDTDSSYFASFTGPFLMSPWRWMSKSLVRLNLIDSLSGKALAISKGRIIENAYLPGKLYQRIMLDSLEIELNLFYSTARTAILLLRIYNFSAVNQNFHISWNGDLLLDKAALKSNHNFLEVDLPGTDNFVEVRFSEPATNIQLSADSMFYQAKEKQKQLLVPGSSLSRTVAISFFENEMQRESHLQSISHDLRAPQVAEEKTQKRWQGYLDKILSVQTRWSSDETYRKIAVKSLLTLINNWKAPFGNLKHSGLIPSYNISYFNGFWAWDSWKHAVALACFEPHLAKEQIRVMFDFQNSAGMIADCVYPDSSEDNWRNSKSPLAAWAVWQVYQAEQDTSFLREMYTKLVKYHLWWYLERDHDSNGLCEFGSVDGTIEAARWESGMDNAARFDLTTMVKNGSGAWSMKQESVDLNAYLYAEKLYLSYIAKILQKPADSKEWQRKAQDLQLKLQQTMFDPANGYFYDKKLLSAERVKKDGPEGWIPLFCGVANNKQAARVKQVMCDSSRFATFVPFPTLSKLEMEFSEGYWRGPVWLDQAYFAIRGLQNYGYRKEAVRFTEDIFNNAAGLKLSGPAIRENYNALNGQGMRVRHFSWSAAHLLLLYLEK